MSTADVKTIQRWHCESCGYIYDVADTWFCPVCGARKRDFTPYDD
jgi:rubredoxin